MKKELNYLIINYTEKDIIYIEMISNFIESHCQEILDFFNVDKFDNKINVYLHDSIDDFRETITNLGYGQKDKNIPLWLCGIAFNGKEIHTLCLSEYIKTQGHKNGNINDLMYLILHEFVHICYSWFTKDDNLIKTSSIRWISEGAATTISHQYDNSKLYFDASLEDIISGCNNYQNYHTMFKYVLEKYGRNYILELIRDYNKLITDTPKLYDEISKYYVHHKKI